MHAEQIEHASFGGALFTRTARWQILPPQRPVPHRCSPFAIRFLLWLLGEDGDDGARAIVPTAPA